MRWPSLPWIFWALSSSLVLHGVAYASLGLAPRPSQAPRISSELAFEVAPLPPPPPLPETPPEPAPMSEAVRSVQRPAPNPVREQQPAPLPKPEPAPAAAAAPVDLSGVTLTNAGSGDFAMQAGNGLAFGVNGPRGGLGGRAAPATSAAPRSEALGPALVPLADLSSRPVPPSLEGALRQHYPEEARRRGISGSARVRARLDPDGVARRIQIEQESFARFGEACRRTLLGSRWSPPRDRSGRPVATEIHYTCRFRVEP